MIMAMIIIKITKISIIIALIIIIIIIILLVLIRGRGLRQVGVQRDLRGGVVASGVHKGFCCKGGFSNLRVSLVQLHYIRFRS